jgi:hypothetical protein
VNLHLLVPEGIDDPLRPSGGNAYDRRVGAELTALGWSVEEVRVSGATVGSALADLPDGALAMVDGLVASDSDALVTESHRLRLVVLLHMPGSGPFEGRVLEAVDAVVVPSRWARGRVPAGRAHVAEPGVDLGDPVTGSAGGGHLLCVGPVTPDKGHDVLVDALGELGDLDWHCRWVGALEGEAVSDDRLTFTGPLPPVRLDGVRSGTDLVVAPSRRESYGMAVAEGLARGIPAVATDVGGHPEAMGAATDGSRPGLLVPVGDPAALATALRRWLTDADLRGRLRKSAARRRRGLPTWADTAGAVSRVLAEVNRRAPETVSPWSGQSSRHRTG